MLAESVFRNTTVRRCGVSLFGYSFIKRRHMGGRIKEEFELDHDFDIPGYDSSLLETLTISLDEADDYMAGYGIISDESKAQMQKAAEKYDEEDAEFSKTYEEYKPVAPQKPLESVSNAPESNNHIGASVVPETPQETPQNALQRRYILCPKCGEKIWL